MITKMVIVVRTIPECQLSTFPIVLVIVLPPQFLWFKIQCPFDFYVRTLQVIWQYAWKFSVLYYILHSWQNFSWCEIRYQIERTFHQEALSPDLRWRKQGLASPGRFCLSGTLYLHQTLSYSNRNPNLNTQHLVSRYLKKTWKVSSIFCPGCVL